MHRQSDSFRLRCASRAPDAPLCHLALIAMTACTNGARPVGKKWLHCLRRNLAHVMGDHFGETIVIAPFPSSITCAGNGPVKWGPFWFNFTFCFVQQLCELHRKRTIKSPDSKSCCTNSDEKPACCQGASAFKKYNKSGPQRHL